MVLKKVSGIKAKAFKFINKILGNEIDFYGINDKTTIFKTLYFSQKIESLDDLLTSTTEKFSLFDANFEISVKYQGKVEESCHFERNQLFKKIEMTELVQAFLEFLIINDKHHYLNELIRKKFQKDGGEENDYVILNLETVKEHLDQIFQRKIDIFDNDTSAIDLARLYDLQKFLFRIMQVFEALISNTKLILILKKKFKK